MQQNDLQEPDCGKLIVPRAQVMYASMKTTPAEDNVFRKAGRSSIPLDIIDSESLDHVNGNMQSGGKFCRNLRHLLTWIYFNYFIMLKGL